MEHSSKAYKGPRNLLQTLSDLATAQLSPKKHSKPGRLYTKVERAKNNKHSQHTEYIGSKNHAVIYR
jgi:hypothetical protein